jgi:hypothetical protein
LLFRLRRLNATTVAYGSCGASGGAAAAISITKRHKRHEHSERELVLLEAPCCPKTCAPSRALWSTATGTRSAAICEKKQLNLTINSYGWGVRQRYADTLFHF